jgi:adhesin transport system outer membrane protein
MNFPSLYSRLLQSSSQENNMTFKRSAMAALIAAVSAPAFSMPLADELRNLLVNHPLVKSSMRSSDASDAGRNVAQSSFYPRVVVSGDTGREKVSSESYRQDSNLKLGNNGTFTPATESDLPRRKLTATIEQNLYAGGRSKAAVDIAELDYQAKENALQVTMQDVLLEGISAYVQIGRYQTLIALAGRNEETTKRQLGLENQRVERGGGIAVDVLQARARLQLVRERSVFYMQGLRDASANYQQVFGHAPDLANMEELAIFTDRLPVSLEAAIEQGRQHNPRLREAFFDSKKAQKQIGAERSGFMPTIDLVGLHSKDKNVNAIAQRDETSLLVRFNWVLFSGLETTYRTKAAGATFDALIEREASVINKADESIRVTWNQLINGREREELLESAASISYDVMQNRKRLRDAGKETAINVLDAEVEYYGVLSNKVNATNDTRIGSYRLLAAIGALTPEALGLMDGARFALPVKPLTLDVGKLDADSSIPVAKPSGKDVMKGR